jgi:prophage DNA circulation protein
MKKPGNKNGKARDSRGTSGTDYSALRDFARGYLNQDFADEYGTAAGAAEAFCEDASADEIRDVAAQWKAFVESVAGMTAEKINEKLSGVLHAGWNVADASELKAVTDVFARYLKK